MTAPLIDAISDAKAKFLAQYGFPAERLHASPFVEKALHRLLGGGIGELREAEVMGMAILRSTKPSPHAEFWLSAVRNKQAFTLHARLTPHEADGRVIRHPGETVLGDD